MAGFNDKTATVNIRAAWEVLRGVLPPAGIVHVGVGSGRLLCDWLNWQVPVVIAIDAVAEKLEWFDSHLAEHPAWRSVVAVLSNAEHDAEFCVASNSDEDGLLEPVTLNRLWPNLKLLHKKECRTQLLSSVVATEGGVPRDTWLIVDCLPALPVLHGAGDLLEDCCVVWVRALLGQSAESDQGADIVSVENFLATRHFRKVRTIEGNHPGIGLVAFMKDHAFLLSLETEKSNCAISDSNSLRESQGALQKEVADLTGQIQSQQQQIDKMAAAKASADKRAEGLAGKLAQAEQSSNQLGVELAKTRDQQRQITEKADALQKALTASGHELQRVTTECDSLRQQIGGLNASVEKKADELHRTAMEIARFTGLVDGLSVEVDRGKFELEAVLSDRAKLEKEYKKVEGQRIALQAQVVEAGKKADTQAKELTDLHKKIESLAQANESAEKDRRKLKGQREELQSEQEKMTAMNIELRSQLDAAGMTVAAMEVKTAQAALEADGLRAEIDALNAANGELVNARHQIEREFELAREKSDEVNLALETANRELDERARQLDASHSQMAELSALLDASGRAVEERTAEVEALRQANSTLSEAIAGSDKDRRKVKAQRDELHARLDALAKTTETQAAELEQSRGQIEKLQGVAEKRKSEIESLLAAKEAFEKESRKLVVRRDELQAEIASMTAHRNQQVMLATERQELVLQLQSRLAEWEFQQAALMDDVTRAEAQIDLIKDVLFRDPGL